MWNIKINQNLQSEGLLGSIRNEIKLEVLKLKQIKIKRPQRTLDILNDSEKHRPALQANKLQA